MIIENKKVVSLHYVLTVEGDLIEQTSNDNPFVFLYGAGNMLPLFEQNLSKLKVGDSFDFSIDAKNGYGEFAEDHVISIPLEAFRKPDGEIDYEALVVGNELPMTDHEGNRLNGIVEEITETHVRMDFNHPLAGSVLHFKGEVLDIRDASSEELSHGHVHGPGGHHH